MKITWYGKEKVQELTKVLEESVLAGGLILLNQTRELAPKVTRQLANSYTLQTNSFDSGFGTGGKVPEDYAKIDKPNSNLTGHVGSNLEYASKIEFGSQKVPAQSHLRLSLETMKDKIINMTKEKIKAIL